MSLLNWSQFNLTSQPIFKFFNTFWHLNYLYFQIVLLLLIKYFIILHFQILKTTVKLLLYLCKRLLQLLLSLKILSLHLRISIKLLTEIENHANKDKQVLQSHALIIVKNNCLNQREDYHDAEEGDVSIAEIYATLKKIFGLFIRTYQKLFIDVFHQITKASLVHVHIIYCTFVKQKSKFWIAVPINFDIFCHRILLQTFKKQYWSHELFLFCKYDLKNVYYGLAVIFCLFVQSFIVIKVQMSTNRFGTYRPKLDETQNKDLTPKSSKYSPKISPVFSSMRGGMTLKQDPSTKIKITKPSTTKNTQESAPYFHSKENNDKKLFYNSNKRLELTKNSNIKNSYEYQPRSKSKSPAKQVDQIVREEIFIQPKTFNIEERGIRTYQNEHPNIPKVLTTISNFEPAKHSKNGHGTIRAYSASTNQGPVRQYNQDRVAIILNFAKPEHVNDWKKPAYFGVFDGHGGMHCADFLRDNLHTFISKQKSFPNKMEEAIRIGFQKCQKAFLQQSYLGKLDKSGSCGLISFFYGKECYISNVGDSRAIMSSKKGQIIRQLSIDHKASDDYEQKRIIEGGGRIYQTKIRNANPNLKIFYQGEEHSFILGPHRAFPGRLSVTRTFGDIQAKFAQFGGNSKAIICTPQISSVSITEEDDFIILGCDGIYDKLSNSQVIQIVWETFKRDKGSFQTIHQFCGKAIQNIMKLAFNKKTLDNITVVMIAFEGLESYFQTQVQVKPPTADIANVQVRKSKGISKLENSFQRKYVGRSVSPSNYNSLRTKSYYRPS